MKLHWNLLLGAFIVIFTSLILLNSENLFLSTIHPCLEKTQNQYTRHEKTSDPPNKTWASLLSIAASRNVLDQSTVLIAEVNLGFVSMAQNFLIHLKTLKHPVKNVVLVALDLFTYETLKQWHDLVYLDESRFFSQGDLHFRTSEYNQVVIHKWELLLSAMLLGYNVLISDVDVVFLRNPFLYLIDTPDACDLVVTIDTLPPGLLGDDDFKWSQAHNDKRVWINTGLMYWKYTNESIAVIKEFLLPHNRMDGMDDQFEFNEYLKLKTPEEGNLETRQDFLDSRTRCNHYGVVDMQILTPYLFGSHRHMFEFRLPSLIDAIPYTIHYNWLSGYESKHNKMKEHGLWLA